MRELSPQQDMPGILYDGVSCYVQVGAGALSREGFAHVLLPSKVGTETLRGA